MSIEIVNPTTGEWVRSYPETTPEEVATIIEATHRAHLGWRSTGFDERSKPMHRAAEVLRDRKDELARLMAVEMGKPLSEGRSEIEKCAWVCNHYAENAAGYLASQAVETEALKSFVAFRPLGVVLAVMPWNFPHWQVFRFAAPALMAGNAGILKHASNVPGSALAIEEVFRQAGFPEDLFRTLLIGSGLVSAVIEHPHVKAVTLTGSTPAGRAVAAKAGHMLKKTVLELGGSDPYVILDDADVERAVGSCVKSRLINAGQSCIAAKRFIVTPPHREAFEARMVELMAAKRMGDPLREETEIGPQARVDLRDELHQQVEGSIARGARCLLGGVKPEGPGAFYPPTVLTDVAPGMPAYDDELFGPVAAVIPVEDEQAAIRTANDTVFGLGAAVFTKDREKGERLAVEEIEAGSCFVNAFVRSDPRLPFGGIKESGYGRELAGFGIREFVNIKTVWVD